MKLLLLTRCLDTGGAERQLVTLAKALAAEGRPPVVAVFYRGERTFEQELTAAGVTVHHLGKRGRWELAGFAARVRRMALSERPTVAYSMLPTPNLVLSSVRLVLPRLRVVWGVRASQLDASDYSGFNSWTVRLQRLLASSADAIIANSHVGRRDLLAAGYPERRVHVVWNGIDTTQFRPMASGRERLRREWGVSPAEKLIGIVARFDPMKDHDTFFRAARSLAAARPDVRFVCVGTGPPDIVRRIRSSAEGLEDRLIWAGARTDMPDVYSAFDLCVLSSAYGEGFPNVLGEALACGTRCASTSSGDAEAILNGLGPVVHPRNAEELAAAVSRTLDEGVTDEWRREARARVCSRFSVSSMVANTERVLWPHAVQAASSGPERGE